MEELKLSVNNHYCDEVRGPLVPSMGRQRSYLFNYPTGAGLPGLLNHRLCSDLRGPDTKHRGRWQYYQSDMDLRRLYGAAVLHAAENRKSQQVNLCGPLTEVMKDGLCTRSQGPDLCKNKGHVQSDQTTVDLFRKRSRNRHPAFLFAQVHGQRQHGGYLHGDRHAAILPAGYV